MIVIAKKPNDTHIERYRLIIALLYALKMKFKGYEIGLIKDKDATWYR